MMGHVGFDLLSSCENTGLSPNADSCFSSSVILIVGGEWMCEQDELLPTNDMLGTAVCNHSSFLGNRHFVLFRFD